MKPDQFTDAGRKYDVAERERNLEGLRRHLVERASRRLAPGEALALSITDVDLAGSFEATQRYSNQVRIVRDVYPPRIDFDFRLVRGDGSVAMEGHRSLRDPGFLLGPNRYSSDALGYEKTLLDAWLESEWRGKP